MERKDMSRFILLIVLGSCAASLMAQQEIFLPYDNKTFEISAIKVKGNEYSDEKAIISVSGLRVGQKIALPGPEIPNAIKAIYRQRLFSAVDIVMTGLIGDAAVLEIRVTEKPRYSSHSFKGVKKSAHEDLNTIVNGHLPKNSVFTEELKADVVNALSNHFIEKGFADVQVNVLQFPDDKKVNAVKLLFDIRKGKRVKISHISFEGNKHVSDFKLSRKMEKTRAWWHIFTKSKLTEEDYTADKEKLIAYYNSLGFRNAAIVSDSIWRKPNGNLRMHIKVYEGDRFYFRNIYIKGNSLYPEEHIRKVLGIQKGDVYNQELLEKRLSFSQDGRDVSSLYMDEGYLFFRAEPVEVKVLKDSVDIEIRIIEGPQATIDKVNIYGNDRTNEHVIRRELRTRPGQKFSRRDIIASQRAILALGFFNQEKLDINTPVNPRRGTVDIEYTVEERPSDQLELSAGFSAFGLVGTLGVVFNNFSTRNIFNKAAWSPLPQGDGQKLSLRAQSNGKFFQAYNFSFTEPWLGGRKPTSLSLGGVYSYITDLNDLGVQTGYLSILRFTGGLGTQLTWPDDAFATNTSLNLERIRLSKYPGFVTNEGESVTNGDYYNISLRQTFVRSTVSEPLFPRGGSRLSLTVALTPPYSLFRGRDWRVDTLSTADKYRWVEYHKWRIDGEWYFNVWNKLVFAFNAKMGFIGHYNAKLGTPPFERFDVGGNGLNNQALQVVGRDIIAMRAYEIAELKARNSGDYFRMTQAGGRFTPSSTVFNKFTLELRYPLSLNPSATIFTTLWAQGGNAWQSFREYNPFELKRSVGLGLRVFLPMFGLLGFDYGWGFDKPWLQEQKAPIKSYANFNFILGFEPD